MRGEAGAGYSQILVRDLNIPILRFAYDCHHRVVCPDRPAAAALCLAQEVVGLLQPPPRSYQRLLQNKHLQESPENAW